MRLKALFVLLASVLAAPALAVTVNPGDDLAGLLKNATANETFTLAAGTFSFTSPITVPSNVTITGTDPSSTHVYFNLTGTNSTNFGFVLPAGATNITFTQMDIHSNHGIVLMSLGNKYKNISITHNMLQYGNGAFSDGTGVFGIYAPVATDNFQITHNYFHDCQGTQRNWVIWYATNSNFDYNLFYNIEDGGQLDLPGANVSFSWNYGTLIHRMGQEIPCQTITTLLVQNNVFYDWYQPYYNSFGVSVVVYGGSITIANNYFGANIDSSSNWGVTDASGTHRFGYAIESGDNNVVENNTIVGDWTDGVTAGGANTPVENNKKYGPSNWGDWIGEPGADGYGSVIDTGTDLVDRNLNDAPAPPENTFAGINTDGSTSNEVTVASTSSGDSSTGSSSTSTGSSSTGSSSTGSSSTGSSSTGSTGSTSNSNPTSTSTITGGSGASTLPLTGMSVSVLSPTSVKLNWTSPNPDIVSVQINIVSTVGRQNFPSQTATGNLTTLDVTGLHAGWYIDFVIVATGSNGQTYTSKPITAFLPGNAFAPWAGTLWGGISTVKTNPWL